MDNDTRSYWQNEVGICKTKPVNDAPVSESLTLKPEHRAALERGELCIVWFGTHRIMSESELLAMYAACD